MKDKYLGKDGITEKYDFRGKIINYFKTIGTVGGGVYVILSLGPNNLGEILVGGGVGTSSYFLGNYLNKVNEKKKQKALKNLEEVIKK